MGKTLAEEAAEFQSQRKTPKKDNPDKIALRFYMGTILGGAIASGTYRGKYRTILMEECYELAKRAVEYEKENF